MYILAFDPGGTTGWRAYDEPEFHGGFLGPDPHHIELWGLLESLDPGVVVCESFQHTMGKSTILISVEYIGIIKLWCKMRDRPLHMLTSSRGKGFWSDEKLKYIDAYTVNKHTRDATRHLLHYLSFDLHDNTYIEMLRR